MAANPNPIFALVPNLGVLSSARIVTANAGRDGTGTLGICATGGTNGSRIDRIVISATSTTTAGFVRLFITDGSSIRFWKEFVVTALTPSGTVAAFTTTLSSPDSAPLLVLPATWSLKAGTHNAESFDVLAFGGDF